ncbi:RNA-directed DNA polymerase, eukaryota, reverse transcriptase zinc-binding domain protein [Tanacetum coccineum]|uniref:RNA-directed DNA polymerase, eukaryota, reverse transcriptase zinc-binding domain protein n=1 Tax=Tanacetum coccineum TaxID=301880 RepID=A0ABQ5EWE7_9ASTR
MNGKLKNSKNKDKNKEVSNVVWCLDVDTGISDLRGNKAFDGSIVDSFNGESHRMNSGEIQGKEGSGNGVDDEAKDANKAMDSNVVNGIGIEVDSQNRDDGCILEDVTPMIPKVNTTNVSPTPKIVNVPTATQVDPPRQSYAKVTTKFKVLIDNKLKTVPTRMNENGDEYVIFNDELINEGSSKWNLTLCGYFVGCKMHINVLRYNIRRMLSRYGFKEDINMSIDKTEPDKLPLWVRLCNLPLEAWFINGINALASRIGKHLIIDAMTASMCKHVTGRIGYTKVLVEVRAKKGLPENIDVVYQNALKEKIRHKTFQVKYDWTPPLCTECRVFGHSQDKCKKDAKEHNDSNAGNEGCSNEQGKNDDGIIVEWDGNCVNMVNVNISKQVILYMLESTDNHMVSFMSCVYVANSGVERRDLWRELNRPKVITIGHPWVICGDFNVNLNANEHSTGSAHISNDMVDFSDCVNQIEVDDLCCFGLHFTWTKNLHKVRKGDISGTLKKLDRVIVNEDFINKYPLAQAIFKPYLISDHTPVLLIMPNCLKRKKTSFKFANYITDKEEFLKIIEEKWNVDINENVKKLKNDLKDIQTAIDADPFNIRERESALLKSYLDAVSDEEKLLYQKSGQRFEGDQVAAQFVNHFNQFLGNNPVVLPIMFCHDDIDSEKVIKKSIEEFGNFSGLLPNFSKSTIFFGSTNHDSQLCILDILPFSIGKFAMKYLGVPLISKRLGTSNYKALLDKIKKKVNHWRNKCLSYVGKHMLISSVLEVIQMYWCNMFLLPKTMVKEINKVLQNLLWNNDDSSKGSAKVAWKTICKPKKYGGLGLKDISLKDMSVWVVHKEVSDSWGWKNLLGIRDVVLQHIKYEIGNGKKTFMWYDNWSGMGPLINCITHRSLYDARIGRSSTVADICVECSSIVKSLSRKPCHNKIWSIVRRLCVGAVVYFIWCERNFRIFRNEENDWKAVLQVICDNVKLRLMKDSRDVAKAADKWGIKFDL